VVPAGHWLKGVHAETLPPVLKVPSGHVLQSSSIVELPLANRYVPSPHGVNGVHAGALVVVLKPMLHVAHIRSAVAVPAMATNWPGLQVVYGAQELSLVAVPGTLR
jgi:hypothetical protein